MLAGRADPPPAARSLGFELLNVDRELGLSEARFVASAQFLNSMGRVQGGFLSAMLDAAMGSALASTLPAGSIAPTLELKISYLRPAEAGPLIGRGRVVQRGGSVAFLEGELRTEAGELVATASSTVRIIDRGGG